MRETGYLTPAQAGKYSQQLPRFPKVATNERYGGPKGFLLKMVERELSQAGFEASQVSGGGLKITTTFDKESQDAAVDAAQKYTKEAANAADRKAVQAARGRRLGRRGHRGGARSLRRAGLRQELPQLGHHAPPDRVDVQDLRGRRRAEGRLQPELAFNGNTFTPPVTAPRSATSSPTSTVRR